MEPLVFVKPRQTDRWPMSPFSRTKLEPKQGIVPFVNSVLDAPLLPAESPRPVSNGLEAAAPPISLVRPVFEGRAAVIMPLADQKGGCETMLLRFLRENKTPNGSQIDYVVAFLENGPMVEQVRGMGYDTTVFPAGQFKNVPRFWKTVGDMARWLREKNAKIAMSWMEKGQLYAGPAALLARIPSVWWEHTIPKKPYKNVWINIIATVVPSAGVFCVGTTVEAGQKTLKPLRPTYVPGIGIELAQFDPATLPTPAACRQIVGLPQNVPIIGMVARLQRWKGVHVFLEAAARVGEQGYPDAHFVVVGGSHFDEPNYETELLAQVQASGIADRVHLVGFQSNVPQWMNAFDIFVHASDNEPTGAVIVEALALGKCVIAAQTAGPMELAVPGESALFVPPGEPEKLAQTICQVLENPKLQKKLQSAAPLQARKFGIDRLTVRVAQMLRQVAGQEKGTL